MRATFIFAWVQLRKMARDPVALFFTIALPMMLLIIFGSIFRGDDGANIDIAVVNNSDSEFAAQVEQGLGQIDALTVKDVDDPVEAINDNNITSYIELPADFGELNEQGQPTGSATVRYSGASPEGGQITQQILDGMLSEINNEITGAPQLFEVEGQTIQSSDITQFDYIVAGIVGFALMSLGVFGLAYQFPYEKKTGTLRRLRATPFTKPQIIFGTLVYYGAIGAVAIALMIAVAVFALGFELRADALSLIVFSLFSIALMLGFGLLIGGISRTENQAAVATNIIAFPLMFLSGVFFPRFLMPEWLQAITDYVPLTPVIDGLRVIMTEGAMLHELLPQLAIMAVWFVVVYALAIRFFRWQ